MISSQRPSPLFVLITMVALAVVLVAAPAAAARPGAEELVAERQSGSVAGDYQRGDDRATFSALRGDDGRITLAVDVNGIAFDASYDPASGVFRLDGQGRRLPVAERDVLRDLVRRLERDWGPDPALSELDRLSYRLLNLLSEAPASFVFDAMTITDPSRAAGGSGPDGAAPAGCEDIDDGDNVYIDCAPQVGPACHDACPEHGFLCLDENLGCDEAGDCLGRCGAGCSDDGTGTYRQDCADHDSCCREHGGCLNPFDDFCGDEYFEAADDFLFSEPNCEDCLDDCVLEIGVAKQTVRPGDELEVDVYLLHTRPETVRQGFRMRLVAADGRVVAVYDSPEIEIAQGDELRRVVPITVPLDAAPGIYELAVGMNGMEQGLAVRSVTISVEP